MMKSAAIGVIWGLGLMLWWGLTVPGIAWAKSPELKKQIDQERKGLTELQKEIQKTKQKRDSAKHQHRSLLKNIERLDQEISQLQKENDELDQQVRAADQELRTLEEQLQTLQNRLGSKRDAVRQRLRLLYMEGRGRHLQPLVASRNFQDFQHRFDYLAAVARWDFVLLETYRRDLEKVKQLQAQLVQSRERLVEHKSRNDRKRQARNKVKAEKRLLLASIRKEKSLHQQALEALKRRENQKENLLKALEQRRKLAEARKRKPKRRAGSSRALLWPAEGKVVTQFGRQKHPDFDTFVNKKGIEIKTTDGSAIQAVSAGTVVYADWLKGYGLVVILDHTDSFFSLYAHASQLAVKEGDRVNSGDILGRTGDSGLTERGVLYFELRKGTTPVNPLKYLVKRP